MTSVTMELVGVKDAIRSLNKIEPGLRKQFADQANEIARPAIQEAGQRYMTKSWGESHVRGVRSSWKSRGRQIGKFSIAKASSKVKIKLEGDRNKTATILLVQADASAAVLETAGRRTKNRLGDALGAIKAGTSRVLGPAALSKRREIEDELRKATLEVMRRVQRELD